MGIVTLTKLVFDRLGKVVEWRADLASIQPDYVFPIAECGCGSKLGITTGMDNGPGDGPVKHICLKCREWCEYDYETALDAFVVNMHAAYAKDPELRGHTPGLLGALTDEHYRVRAGPRCDKCGGAGKIDDAPDEHGHVDGWRDCACLKK